ncbi:FMN-linked oxidoreductase [Fomitiporia mediterranea MF3/22]|uniref:FMN-linked oxidoreductase n=1 Tax=Fomitiporia mediterranea (strain MF3/22) TaxID=694068 RepID=UPI0004408CE0|nr:FMN-linked oxidoreductase [Fomitiporia mediterranea MF3/22]EJD04990.1 FMN-linked oxidoreductase [Fomitiporia mediterranea MF3/22]
MRLNSSAPMVRYSKLPFRHLASLYNCHITHTPMILAAEFSRSANARLTDFSTSSLERGSFLLQEKGGPPSTLAQLDEAPNELGAVKKARQKRVRGALIAQFAASEPGHFADAVELIRPHVDGVDLNCGCPQGWAYQEQIGCWLLRHPDKIADIIRAAKNRVESSFPISIKIRVDPDLKITEQLIQTAIHAGVSHITVHGRTRHQVSTQPVSLSSIAFAVSAAKGAVPVVANGDAWDMNEVNKIRKETRADGVMSARGLLANPALFSGYDVTPPETIRNFVRISTDYGLLFPLFHRHLSFILESQLSRHERADFNSLASYAGIIDYLEARDPTITQFT